MTSENNEDPEYMVKRSMLEAAGLDPDSDLARQPFHVILQEIQLIKAGVKTPDPPAARAKPPKERTTPKKEEVCSKAILAEQKTQSESKTDNRLEQRIQCQYQASLTEILGLWDESIKCQRNILEQVCGFLNVQKYGLGEEFNNFADWAAKAARKGLTEAEFNKEMKKKAENLQQLFNKTLSSGENMAKNADNLRGQIQRYYAPVKGHNQKMDELSKNLIVLFEKFGEEI